MRILLCLMGVVLCAGGSSCARQPDPPPFRTAATIEQIMEGPIVHAAEVYWDSVSTVVDKDGIHENFPQNDEEWEAVWAAGISIAESGNLLMIADRARDEEWVRLSAALADTGMEAAQAAEAKNPDKVLEMGEKVYNVCTECHMKYIVDDAN